MGEDPIATWLGNQPASPAGADPIGTWLGQQNTPKPPAPGFFDALGRSFPELGGFIEGATPVVKEGVRHAGDIALGLGKSLVTPPSQQAADLATDLAVQQATGTLDPGREAIRGTTGVDIKGQPIDIAEDLLAFGLGGKLLGERAPTERPVPQRPIGPSMARGTPARPVVGELVPSMPAGLERGGTPADVVGSWLDEQRALPPHEPPGLPAAREPIVPPAPAGPRGLLPEQGGGPFAQPGEELPPRINEASRNQFPRAAPAPIPPPDAGGIYTPAPAGPSDLDLVAQALGYRNAGDMARRQPDLARRIGDAGAPQARASRPLDPTLFRERPTPSAEPAATPAVETRAPEPTPQPPSPVDAVQDFLARPEATPEASPIDHEANAAFPEVLADARQQGYTGTDEDLRQKFDENVRGARNLQNDMRSIARQENPTGRALLQAIADAGGLRFDPEHPYSGELADLWESMTSGTSPQTTKMGRTFSRRLPTAGLEGIPGIMRQGAGLDLGALSEFLGQDPQFRALLADQGEGAMHAAMVDALNTQRRGLERVPTFGEAMRFSGVEPGTPWWKDDVLDTGETQPRLPGETGAVREQERPTPEEDFPFSLEREAADRGEVQPELREEAPAEPQKTVRLYRGESDASTPGALAGQTFTDSPLDATFYAKQGGGAGRTFYIDLPADEAARYRTADVTGQGVHVLPPELAERARGNLLGAGSEGQSIIKPKEPIAAPATPKNLRDFLVRQLGIPPNEVDAMTPEQATALGESVRTHPEGVQAGIRANRRLPPANPEPVPALQVAGRGPLNAQVRRTQMLKTGVPRSDVNVPRGTATSTELVPRRTPEQRLAAGERLTEGERAQAGLEPSAPPERPQYSPSELGIIQSGIREAARDRARLLEAGTPESLAEYEKLLAEANDRQAQRELVHNRGDEPKRTGRGEILAGGPLGFLAYAPEAWNTLKSIAPDVARAVKPMLPESLGGEPGKPLGTQELRRTPNPNRDMNPALHIAHPNYALPDLWKQIRPELELAHEASGEQAPPGVDKATWAKVTHDLWHGDAIKTVDQYAQEARANGRPNAALYARMMASQLRGLPTVAEKIAEAVTFGQVSPQRARSIFRAMENVLYNRLFIGAVDTGLLTRSQVLAAMPHLGLGGVLEGLREGRTPEGKALAQGVTNLSPTDTRLTKKIPNNMARKLVTLVTNPVGVAHQANRRDTFLSGVHVASQAGASPEEAKNFAYDLQELVHGSPLSTNPYLRHLGPLRMLSKYPIVMAQLQHAILTHPDPGVRRRGIGFLLGAGAVGLAVGVSTMDYFLPHLRTAGGPALKIAQDAIHHVMGNSDHSIWEDLDPRRGGTALTGRYPAKVLRAVEDVSQRGLGTHTKYSPQGQPEGETSGVDELANLLGLHSRYGLPDLMGMRDNNEADRNAAMDEATQFIQNAERDRNISGRLAREDAARGDAGALERLTPSQRRSFEKAQRQTAFRALLARVPAANRREFIEKFADRFSGGS